MNIVETTKIFAFNAHKSVNQLYDNHPYEFHLKMVASFGEKFIYLIPEKDRDDVIAGCLAHDLIEDANKTYNDLVKATNRVVAELAYACTNNKGRNRAERANDAYYEGIRNTKYATFVKLCDRIANVQYSLENKSRMVDLYLKENDHFKKMLYVEGEYEDMWKFLDNILHLYTSVKKYNV